MSDTEFYTQIGMSVVGLYLLPIVLFFYIKHLYTKYKKKQYVVNQEEIAAYTTIKKLEKTLENEK